MDLSLSPWSLWAMILPSAETRKAKLCGVGWMDATLATTDSMYTSPAATPLSAEPAPTGVAKVTTSFWSEAEMQGGVTTDAPAWADCLYQGRAVGS